MTEDTKKLETLKDYPEGYINENDNEPASASREAGEKNTPVIRPEIRVNNSEVAGQVLEQVKYPEMCENTKKIVKACRQVVQSAEDYDNDTMTTPVTVVQACERINWLLKRLRNEAEQGMIEMGFKPATLEQPNQNIKIIGEIDELMDKASKKVDGLSTHTLKNRLHQEIHEIQDTTLFDLRKEFE